MATADRDNAPLKFGSLPDLMNILAGMLCELRYRQFMEGPGKRFLAPRYAAYRELLKDKRYERKFVIGMDAREVVKRIGWTDDMVMTEEALAALEDDAVVCIAVDEPTSEARKMLLQDHKQLERMARAEIEAKRHTVDRLQNLLAANPSCLQVLVAQIAALEDAAKGT